MEMQRREFLKFAGAMTFTLAAGPSWAQSSPTATATMSGTSVAPMGRATRGSWPSGPVRRSWGPPVSWRP